MTWCQGTVEFNDAHEGKKVRLDKLSTNQIVRRTLRLEVPGVRTVSCHWNVRVNGAESFTYGMSMSYVGYLLFSTYRCDLRKPGGKYAPPPTVERLFHVLLTKPMSTT